MWHSSQQSTGQQIQCRGRGETPEPEAVNSFVWTLMTYLRAEPCKHVIVHCTHGFNRTGASVVLSHCSTSDTASKASLQHASADRVHARELHGAPWPVRR